jgi:hypothetical protein
MLSRPAHQTRPVVLAAASGVPDRTTSVAPLLKKAAAPVTVALSDCVESIGVALAATAAVRPLVPAAFVLAGQGGPVTPVVVRTARCSVSVNGARAKVEDVVQIGAIIAPPDGTGDVNSALLLYYTSDSKLAKALGRLGVDAQHVPTIDYALGAGAAGAPRALRVTVPKPGAPTLALTGTVVAGAAPAGAFVANWWAVTAAGVVKMTTSIRAITVGGASLTLEATEGGALAALLGGAASGFPVLQQFNGFASATLTATVAP